ncbi:MAG: hypothetical protein JWN70_1140 [Planctomycetaceae bacterium]|nr:hypothetical protein [Planctomycetaceae bacterium]
MWSDVGWASSLSEVRDADRLEAYPTFLPADFAEFSFLLAENVLSGRGGMESSTWECSSTCVVVSPELCAGSGTCLARRLSRFRFNPEWTAT